MRPVKKDIQVKIEVVLSRKEGKGFLSQLRIVRWIVDGKVGEPMLEKRSFRMKKDGTYGEKGKATGFNKLDWQVITDNLEDIGMFLR
jgi:hypothetical protein